jgi:hypothetical protein
MSADPDELDASAARLETALERIARAPAPAPAVPELAAVLDALIARLRAALEETP